MSWVVFRYVAVLLIAGSVATGAVFLDRERSIADAQLTYTVASASLASTLERRLFNKILVTRGVMAAFQANPDLSVDRFGQLVTQLVDGQDDVLNVAATRGYVIEYVHPLAENGPALGLDLRDRPEMLAGIDRAIETGEVIVQGPFSLVQGGNGYITRGAILDPEGRGRGADDLIGIASVVLDAHQLFVEAGFETRFPDAVVSVVSEDGAVLYGPSDADLLSSVGTEVSFPGGTWTVFAAPAGGWPTASPNRNQILIELGIGTLAALVIVLLFGRFSDRAHRAETQLEDALNVVDDGFAIYDPEDTLVMCNNRYREMFETPDFKITRGAHFKDILWAGLKVDLYPEAIGDPEAWAAERFERHARLDRVVEQQLKDGRWVRVVERRTTSGHVVSLCVDITAMKTALAKSEAASAAKSSFLNTMSHELRTPLTVVLGYNAFVGKADQLPAYKSLCMALDAGDAVTARGKLDALAQELTRLSGQIEASGQQLLELISGILDLAAIEAGAIQLHPKWIDLSQLAQSVMEQVEPLAAKKGLALSIDAMPVKINGDPLRLRQILFNLMGNAIKFTETGGVSVQVGGDERGVWVEVRDTGRGMKPEDVERIFERFGRLDTTDSGAGGVGLGLPIAQQLAKLHGGRITVESTEGEGSLFRLELLEARVATREVA